jgi:hypothetical protein
LIFDANDAIKSNLRKAGSAYGVGEGVTISSVDCAGCVGNAVWAEVLMGAPMPLDSPTATQNMNAHIKANMITEATTSIRAVGCFSSMLI